MNTKKYIKYLIVTCLIFIVLFVFFFYVFMFPVKYRQTIVNYCKIYGVNASLVAGIIYAESGFNPNVVSTKGAVGLMQLMPTTAQWICSQQGIEYSLQNLTNAEFNIKLGVWYVGYLNKRFNSNDLVIMAYNAGEGTVNGWLKNKEFCKDGKTITNIPYAETKNYLKKVKAATKVYKLKGI